MVFQKRIITFIISFFALCISAQNVDSLKIALTKVKQDSTRCQLISVLVESAPDGEWEKYNDTLFDLAEKNLKTYREKNGIRKLFLVYESSALNNYGYIYDMQGNTSKALFYYQKSLKIQGEIDDKKGMAYSLSNLGFYYNKLGQVKEALNYFEKSLKIREDISDKIGIAQSLINIGAIYQAQGNIPLALEYYQKSLKIQEETNDRAGIANSLNNIAFIYASLEENEKALEYYQRCLIIRKEIGDKQGIASSLNNIGNIFKDKGNVLKAIDYYEKGLKIREEIKNKAGIGNSLNSLGTAYLFLNKDDKALDYFERSLRIQEEIGNKNGIVSSLNNIGLIYAHQNKYDKALGYGLRSLDGAKELAATAQIRDAANLLRTIYKKQNKNDKALEMYELYVQMRDSVNNQQNRKISLKTQFQYDYDKKEAVLTEQQEKERMIAEEKSQRQKFVITGVIIGLILVVIFSVFIYNRLQITRKQKLVIEQQKLEVEQQKDVIQEQKHLVEEHQKEIIDSINYAKRIQYALLASDGLLKNNLPEHFVLFKPKDVVSGDFYWATPTDDGFIYITADCTGHGVPGAFMSLLNISKLSQTINENKITRPDLVLNNVRSEIIRALNPEGSLEESKDGMDAIICKLNIRQMKLEYAAANNSFYIVRNNELLNCKADKMPVGKGHDDSILFTYNEIALQKGDTIYTLTDGYADQFGGDKGKKFRYKQLEELLLAINNDAMPVQKEKLKDAFEKWLGSLEQVDDVCIIGVRI